jgi:GMP synthase-like glutamine amidotransferase
LVETIELDEGGELPDWREADLVVAMGGPMSAHDEIEHPRLAGEKRWIAAAVQASIARSAALMFTGGPDRATRAVARRDSDGRL